MVARNTLLTATPWPVARTLRRLGADLRTARLRRNLTIAEVAEKIGTGPRPVADAEKGKASTSVAVYMALLWAYDMLNQLAEVGDPALDTEGQALSPSRKRARAGKKQELDSDF